MNEARQKAAQRKRENIRVGVSADAIYALIRRIANARYASIFEIAQMTEKQPGMDCFQMEDIVVDGTRKIRLAATSGVAAAAALRWYLQERCGCYIGPMQRRMELPDEPPMVGGCYENESPFLYRYFFNFCTFGYTCAFWDWQEWKPFLDWLLLSGYNLILNPIGNERVWINTLLALGYSREDARAFISSPVFYPWQCMLNISGWGGAAPESWYDDRAVLSRKITSRLRAFGADVVYPGYSGIVPNDFSAYFPAAQLVQQGTWCDFPRPALLSHKDRLFTVVADQYYSEQKKLFGTDTRYFAVDPFHEGGNSSKVDMKGYGQTCYTAMQKAASEAVWVLQGWTTNPNREMLTGLQKENVLILNLKSEVHPDGGDNFCGYPWLYCSINNFGARRDIRGNLIEEYTEPHRSLKNKEYSIVGTGLLPEGVEIDPCLYDAAAEIMFWAEPRPIEEWLKRYITVRYGCYSENLYSGWRILMEKVYIADTSLSSRGGGLSAEPSLSVAMVTPSCQMTQYTYHPQDLVEALEYLEKDSERLADCDTYRSDMIDFANQILSLASWEVIRSLQTAFISRDRVQFDAACNRLMQMYAEQAVLTAADPSLSLKRHLEMAARQGRSEGEKAYFIKQEKRLITLWGNEKAALILHDYSSREWNGMVLPFYRERWRRYIQHLYEQFETASSSQEIDEEYDRFAFEQEFCSTPDFPPEQEATFCEAMEVIHSLLAKKHTYFADAQVEQTRSDHVMELH